MDLKRIKTSKHNNQTHLVSWALSQHSLPPGKRTEIVQFAGLTAQSYSNNLGNDHTKVSKQWRISNNKRHDHISQFSLKIFDKNDYDLSPMMKMLKHVPCDPKTVEVMWKTINNGLYIGTRAHNYLVDTKNQHPNGEKNVPRHCIFLQHTFDPTYVYRPRHPKPIKDTIATYEYVVWDSIPAKNVWELAKTTLNNLQIPHTIKAWKDIFVAE